MFEKLNDNLNKLLFPKTNPIYQISAQEIENFEKENKILLPEDFKFFLLNWSGYKVKDEYNNLNVQVVYPLSSRKFGKNYLNITQNVGFKRSFKNFKDINTSDFPKFCFLIEETDGADIFMSLQPGSEGQIFYMENDYYEEEHDYLAVGDYHPEDAIEDFDPANDVIPYYFNKLANSFSEFIEKLKLIDVISLEKAGELRKKGEQLDWSIIIEY